jgi:hypothetical protein
MPRLFIGNKSEFPIMFRVFACLTEQYDWRLVLFAGPVCSLTSLVADEEFSRLGSAFTASHRDTRSIP